jgi:redox-sensitive bicupin YhaK (pirin superfamily)
MKSITRRSFIAILTVFAGLSISKNLLKRIPSMDKNSVLTIKPLGFQWSPPDPFLFCVHHNDKYPAGTPDLGVFPDKLQGRNIGMDFETKDGFRMYHGNPVPGFPAHPHRGFETITIVQKGLADHADSFGGKGRYGNGDVQWMTAGAGIQHSEMFPLINQNKENPLELFQIWLNLPKAKKFADPAYKMFWHEHIPVISEKDEDNRLTQLKIIAGNYKNIKALQPPPDSWASDPQSDLAIFLLDFEPHAKWVLPAASIGLNRVLYFFVGEELIISNQKLSAYHSADLVSDANVLIQNGNTKSRALILQARPLNEPVVQHGPFVMNNREEIQQAMIDYSRTRFGGWPWKNDGPVHGAEPKRFAQFSDGTREVPT